MNLPNNERCESILLGACLNSFKAALEALSALDESDFMYEENKSILGGLKAFFKQTGSLDLYLFSEFLKKNNLLEKCGGIDRLIEVSDSFSLGCDYEPYFDEIKNLSAIRKLAIISQNTLELCLNKNAKYEEISLDLNKKLFSIDGNQKSKTYSADEMSQDYSEHGTFDQHSEWMFERSQKGLTTYTGIASNFPLLDETLGFFRKGAIYYVGARTSMGKTTFMLNLVISMLKNESFPIGIFSLEMPAKMLFAKIVCLIADVSFSAFEDGKIRPKDLKNKSQYARSLPIFIEDDEDITLAKVRSRARRLVQNKGVQIIFIDYLTRIKSDTKYTNKHLQVDEISKGLQSMAKELNVPVICLAQLNRASEGATGSLPSLSSFRESGSIEEDCDGAILLHRPDYYNPSDFPGILNVIIAKNRIRGRLMKIDFKKNLFSERFEELSALNEAIKQCHENRFTKDCKD